MISEKVSACGDATRRVFTLPDPPNKFWEETKWKNKARHGDRHLEFQPWVG